MELTRREFLKVGGGLTFTFAFPLHVEGKAAEFKPNAWVTIRPDDTITILSAGAEMGQGSMTSLPLILAEE
ncbi:MAG: molybdopterin cofactor-binding domain-containing protein, partial [Burkholderiales bacterium]